MKISSYTFYEQTIIDNIDFEGYGFDNDVSIYDKIKTLYNIFRQEYLHENNKHLNIEVVFSEWLRGLPSSCSVPFYNSDILANGLLAGFDLSTEDKENAFLASYFANLGTAFFTLYNNL